MRIIAHHTTGWTFCSTVCSCEHQRKLQNSICIFLLDPYEWNPSVPDGFLSQRARNAESISLSWRYHRFFQAEGYWEGDKLVTKATVKNEDHITYREITDGSFLMVSVPLDWRHNEHDGVSNHRRLDCLPNRIFRRRSKKTSKLRVTGFYEGIHRWPVDSPQKGPVTRKMFPFDDVTMHGNKQYV